MISKLIITIFAMAFYSTSAEFGSLLVPTTTSVIKETFLFGHTEYQIVSSPLIWSEAEIVCETFPNGSMAVIDTNEKINFLVEALSETEFRLKTLWVGGFKGELGGKSGYLWVNNRGIYVPDEMFIKRGNESFNLTEYRNCLSFTRNLYDEPMFVNLVCNLTRPVICEKDYQRIRSGNSTYKWFKVGRSLYNIYYDGVTWRQAVRDCRRKHAAHLASFENSAEVNAVAKNLLVGRPSLENAWIGGYYKDKTWMFVHDSKPLNNVRDKITSFPPWVQDRPLKHSGCLLLDRHYDIAPVFLEARCKRRRSYVCSKEVEEDHRNNTVFPLWNGGYIWFKRIVPWDEAKETCAEIGAVLVKVTDDNVDDIEYIMGENATEIRHIWVGAELIELDGKFVFVWIVDQTIITQNISRSSRYPLLFDEKLNKNAACLNMDRVNHNRPVFYGLPCEEHQQFICQQNPLPGQCNFNNAQIKQEDLSALHEIKEEIPNLILNDCDDLMKSDFHSDDDSLIGNDLELQLSPVSESSDNEFSLKQNEMSRRHRRKSLVPQRAVQSEISQSGSYGNSSECSQDFSEGLPFEQASLIKPDIDNDFVLSDGDNCLDLPGDDLLQDIDEENIFKGLQEEADGEKLDDEMIDNVKEEWRAHWGVKCNMCEQVFPLKADFDRHYMENYALSPVYTCSFCNKTSEKYSTFRSHCYRHITEGRYKCRDCPKGFSLQSMLHVHILAKHTKAKPFMCEECGKSFVTKPGLKIHLKKHKTETKEDYPCVECGKILHTRGGLTSHMNVHRLGRRFMCDVCGKTFTQKVNMQQHVKQHTGDKPHGCDKCGKTFAEKSHLARHYSFHSEQRPFKCDVCQKMYKTERCLKVHSLVHAAARPFVCTYCSKGFLSSTKLKQHYNIHTGERPYKCKYCERTFTNYPNWLKHTRRRHKVDHKTGQELGPKVPKEETPATPAPVAPTLEITQTIESDPLMADITLTKTDELILQQGLLNFPISCDDKFILPQQIDFLAGTSNNSMSFLVPYLQSPLPSHQTLMHNSTSQLPVQFTDLIHSPYMQQQSLPCD